MDQITPKSIFLTSFCLANSLSQLVTVPTRLLSSSILDLILTTDVDIILNVDVSSGPVKSDHLAVYFDLARPRPKLQRTPGMTFWEM